MDVKSIALFPGAPHSGKAERAGSLVDRILDNDKTIPIVLISGIALRIACIALFDVRPISDYRWYYDVAASISSGHGAVFRGRPTAYWPIGYAAFLAAAFAVTGPSVLVAQLLNIALAVGTLALAHRVTLLVGGSPRAARAVVILLALWPNQIAYVSLLANETLASFLVLAGVCLLLERRWWHDVLGGVVFGCACLVKPQAMLLPPLVMIVKQLSTSRSTRLSLRPLLRRIALFYVPLLFVLLPWLVRNCRQFGGPVVIANSGGINLFIGNHSGATGTYPKAEEEAQLLHALAPFSIDADECQFDRKARALAIDYVTHHPATTLLHIPRKLWHLYATDADGFSWIQEGASVRDRRLRVLLPLKLVAQAYYMIILLAAATSLFLAVRRRRALALSIPIGIVAYFSCVYLAFFGISRFHFLMVPWLASCAALGVRASAPMPTTAAARRD
jgi:hypothetical protein